MSEVIDLVTPPCSPAPVIEEPERKEEVIDLVTPPCSPAPVIEEPESKEEVRCDKDKAEIQPTEEPERKEEVRCDKDKVEIQPTEEPESKKVKLGFWNEGHAVPLLPSQVT